MVDEEWEAIGVGYPTSYPDEQILQDAFMTPKLQQQLSLFEYKIEIENGYKWLKVKING